VRSVFFSLLILFFLPVLFAYALLALTVPLIRIGRTRSSDSLGFHISRDSIHSDYIFKSDLWSDFFVSESKFVKIGWGDRKIFLETPTWGELKVENFIRAFCGLNETVLRLEFVDEIDAGSKPVFADEAQLSQVMDHIVSSTNWKEVRRMPWHYQKGRFYESNLKYNCVTNCNNWVNLGLRKAQISNRIWCPLSFWL